MNAKLYVTKPFILYWGILTLLLGVPAGVVFANSPWNHLLLLGHSVKADLVLLNMSAVHSGGSARTFSSCSFQLMNNGPEELSSAGLLVEYYLSDDTFFGDADDQKIGDISFGISIASGSTQTISLSSTGLSRMARNWTQCLVSNGSYYIYAKVAMMDGSPVDPLSNNNYDRTNSTIIYSGCTLEADLALSYMTVAHSGGSARTFSSCSFQLMNNGPEELSSESLLVEYYLSDDKFFGDADDRKIGDTSFGISIASGSTQTISLSSLGLSRMTRDWTPCLVSNGDFFVFGKVAITDGSPADPNSSNDYDNTNSAISYSGCK